MHNKLGLQIEDKQFLSPQEQLADWVLEEIASHRPGNSSAFTILL
jgi:hypothetical protein